MLADDSVCNTTYTCGERMHATALRVITLLRGRNYSKSTLQLLHLSPSLTPPPSSLFLSVSLFRSNMVFVPACGRHGTLLLINSRFVARADSDDSLEFTGCSNIR